MSGASRTGGDSIEHLLLENGWTRRLCSSLLRESSADADDLHQDVWVAAREAPPTRAGLRSWFRRVARNLRVSQARSRHRREVRELRVGAQAQGVMATPEELVAQAQVHRILVELVIGLEEPTRQTVLARYFQDRTAEQIARSMGCPAGTVRWRLSQGLTELREKLEQRLGQGGERKMRAFVLGLPAAAAIRAGGWRVAVVSALVVAFAGLIWQVRGSASTPVAGVSRPVVSVAAAPRAPAVFRKPSASGDCLDRLRSLNAEIALLRAQRINRMRLNRLFKESEPNLRATIELGPVALDMLRGDQLAFPSHGFECRGWVCRLSFTVDDGPPAAGRASVDPGWLARLQLDENLRSRFPGFQVGGPGGEQPTTDPITGRAMKEKVVYLKLSELSGKPRPAGQRGPAQAPATAVAEPPRLAGLGPENCDRERARLAREVSELRAEVDRMRSPAERFASAQPNEALTRKVNEEVLRLASEGTNPRTACRGDLCELSVEGVTGMEDLFRRLRRGPLRTWIDRQSSTNKAIIFFVSPVPRVDGVALLDQRLAELRASGDLERCHRETPLAGTLKLRLYVPGDGHENDDGVSRKISVRFGGTLGWSSLRTCIESAVERHVVGPPLPEPIAGIWREETFTF